MSKFLAALNFMAMLFVAMFLVSSPAAAQNDSILELDSLKRENIDERLTAYGNDLMGDKIDLNTGALSFEHVDVSIPGNSNLEVAIRRTRTIDFPFPHLDAVAQAALNDHYATALTKSSPLSDWDLEIPKISLTIPIPIDRHGVVGNLPDEATLEQTLCISGGIGLTIAIAEAPNVIGHVGYALSDGPAGGVLDGQLFEGDDASNGMELIIPGQGSRKLRYLYLIHI